MLENKKPTSAALDPSSIRRTCLGGLLYAFFHPVPEATVQETLTASRETGRLAAAAIKRADALSQMAAEELKRSASIG